MRKNILFAVLILLFQAEAGIAQSTLKNVGTNVAPFLRIGIGARPSGMGDAYVGVSDDIYALDWNPAGISRIKRTTLTSTHLELFAGQQLEYIGFVRPYGKRAAIGASILYEHQPPLKRTQLNPTRTGVINLGNFRVSDLALQTSVGVRVTKGLSLGGSLKLVQQRIDDFINTGLTFDLSLLYRTPFKGLTIGANVQNMGIFQFDAPPVNIRAGLSYSFLNERVLFALAATRSLDNTFLYHTGLEYNMSELVTLRAGYRIRLVSVDRSTLGGITTGAGFHLSQWDLDYAYVPFGPLGDSHRVSAILKLGPELKIERGIPEIFRKAPSRIYYFPEIADVSGTLLRKIPINKNITYPLTIDKRGIQPKIIKTEVIEKKISPEIKKMIPVDEKLFLRPSWVSRQKTEIRAAWEKIEKKWNEGKYRVLVNELKKWVKRHPNDPVLNYNIAGIYFNLKRYNDAVKYYEKSTSLDPDFSSGYYHEAFAEYRSGNYKRAGMLFKKSLQYEPQNQLIHSNLEILNKLVTEN